MSQNPSSPAFSDQQREARGILGFVKALGTATEQLFRRSYQKQQDAPPQPAVAESGQDRLRQEVQTHEAEVTHLTAVLESIGEGVIMQDNQGASS